MSIIIPSKSCNRRPNIESWIYEQARIDDDDIVVMYNTTMIYYGRLIKLTHRAKWHRPRGKT